MRKYIISYWNWNKYKFKSVHGVVETITLAVGEIANITNIAYMACLEYTTQQANICNIVRSTNALVLVVCPWTRIVRT